METLHDRVLPLAYGVAGRCVGLVQGACFALQSARASLFQQNKEATPHEGAAGTEEPIVASPEKKQRVSSPERTPEADEQQEANKEDAESQQPQQEDQEPEQPGQQRAAAEATATEAAEAKPANGMPAYPTPAEAAGAELQQPIGEVTRLEDVTGVQQPAETFVEAAAKPPGPDADIIHSGGESSASENTSSAPPATATTTAGASANTGGNKATSGNKKKKRSNSRKRKNGH